MQVSRIAFGVKSIECAMPVCGCMRVLKLVLELELALELLELESNGGS